MTESTHAKSSSPKEIVRATLEEAGVLPVLDEALQVAGLDALPDGREALVRLLDGPLSRALIGTLHPTTAGQIIETLRARLAAAQSGTRMKTPAELVRDGEIVLTDSMAATVPPPAGPSASEAYDDLVTGAIHTRVTPAWGIRTVDPDAEPGTTLWIIVSSHPELPSLALDKAPPHVDVVHASSIAVLNAALKRSQSKASVVVLDAEEPSVKLDRALAALTTDGLDLRVVLWRMPPDRRRLLLEAIPHAATWLPCEAEVTPREIMQLLGL